MKLFSVFFTAASLLTSVASFTEETTPVKADETLPLYSSAGRIDVNHSWDIYLTTSYIYWQPKEDGLQLGYIYDLNNPGVQTSIVNMDFDYTSGFKVGLGTSLCQDNWVGYFDYTRLHAKNRQTINYPEVSESSGFNSFWTDDQFDPIAWMTSQWKLRYDMFDLKLSRPFYEGCALTADSFLGIKGGWINQRYLARFVSLLDYNYATHVRSHSWLVGPQAGLSANYHFGAGFRLFGNSDFGLLYQHFKTTLVAQYYNGVPYQNEKNFIGQITPNFDFDMGLGWGTYFDKKNWHFDLLAAYEFQYYWKQNSMKYLVDLVPTTYMTPHRGKMKDLILHGLTITARLDF